MLKSALLCCLLILSAAQGFAAENFSKDSYLAFLARQTAGVVEMTPPELRAAMQANSPILLLDVRTYYERSRTKTILGHKEIHIPRGFLEFKAWDKLPRDQQIVVYCSKGMRSKLAAATLQAMGWSQVSSLAGGVEAWYQQLGEDCGCLPEDREIPVKSTSPECSAGQ